MKQFNKYRLIFFLRYLGDSFFLSFLSVYLTTIGIEGKRLGFALAILPAISVLANLFWGYFSGSMNKNMIIAKYLVLSQALLVFAFSNTLSYKIIIVIMFLIGMVETPYQSFQDSIIGTYCDENKHNFASIRIFGSLSYVIASAVGGFIITAGVFRSIFVISGIIYLLVFLLWQTNDRLTSEKENEPKGDFKDLIKNKNFIIYTIVFVLGIGSLAAGDNYFGVYLRDRGVDYRVLGLIMAGATIIEIVIIYCLINSKYKGKYRLLITLSLIAILIRNIIFAFDPPFYYLLGFSLFKGIGWGAIIVVHINYLVKIVERKHLAQSLMILSSVYSIFVSGLNFLLGSLYSTYGFKLVYLLLSIITFVSLILSLFIVDKKQLTTLTS